MFLRLPAPGPSHLLTRDRKDHVARCGTDPPRRERSARSNWMQIRNQTDFPLPLEHLSSLPQRSQYSGVSSKSFACSQTGENYAEVWAA